MGRKVGEQGPHCLRVALRRLFINHKGKLPCPAQPPVSIRVTGEADIMGSCSDAGRRARHQIFSIPVQHVKPESNNEDILRQNQTVQHSTKQLAWTLKTYVADENKNRGKGSICSR